MHGSPASRPAMGLPTSCLTTWPPLDGLPSHCLLMSARFPFTTTGTRQAAPFPRPRTIGISPANRSSGFGYGLTYTTFEYGPVEIIAAAGGNPASARITITNTGSRQGHEVVQLYIRQLACSHAARPEQELRGFKRVGLEPGERTDHRVHAHGRGAWVLATRWKMASRCRRLPHLD